MRPFAYWDCGSEYRRGRGGLSVVSSLRRVYPYSRRILRRARVPPSVIRVEETGLRNEEIIYFNGQKGARPSNRNIFQMSNANAKTECAVKYTRSWYNLLCTQDVRCNIRISWSQKRAKYEDCSTKHAYPTALGSASTSMEGVR